VRDDDIRPRLQEIYAMFPPLLEKRRDPARTLSGGQRQMRAMGKALMLEPTILLVDEPTAGLSPKVRGEIFAIIRDINRTGTPPPPLHTPRAPPRTLSAGQRQTLARGNPLKLEPTILLVDEPTAGLSPTLRAET
jgi:ABC-type branched-subunit amino acid transport system ATPase component